MKRTVLVISNGRGEDSIAITILKQLEIISAEETKDKDMVNIVALPLVDDGSAYKRNSYTTAATWKTLPSKGFGASSLKKMMTDIKHGLWDILKKQVAVINRESKDAHLIVTVGDVVPFIFACIWGNGRPVVHIGTAMTSYIRDYALFEMWLFRKFAVCVICRDLLTAQRLKEHEVNAVFYGNPMMDDPLLTHSNAKLDVEIKKKHIVLVPSSREDAYDNTIRMLTIIQEIGQRSNYSYVISLAPNLNTALLAKKVAMAGWAYEDLSAKKKPLIAVLRHAEANAVQIVRGYFRECLDGAVAAMGMTGTGNEQIAGMGVPLLLLQGASDAASRSRMVHYEKLLGDAVFAPRGNNKKVAESLVERLEDTKMLTKMATMGRDRMGEPGGAYHIARKIWYYLYLRS